MRVSTAMHDLSIKIIILQKVCAFLAKKETKSWIRHIFRN